MANQPSNLGDDGDQRSDLTLVRVARAGDVKAVESIIEASAPSTHHNLDTSDPHFIFPSVLNEARVWDDIVERDYENVYSWYEDTPLIAAARNGHVAIVKLLLETGYCDPTLESCPADDVYETALVAATKKLEQVTKLALCQERIHRSCRNGHCSRHNKSPDDPVRMLATRHQDEIFALMKRYKQVLALLSASLKYWSKVPYSAPHAGTRNAFTNRMKDPTMAGEDSGDKSSFNVAAYESLIADHKKKLSSALESVTDETTVADIAELVAGKEVPKSEAAEEAPFVGSA